MDQAPHGNNDNEGFANNNNLFTDSQPQFNAYDSLFPTGADQNSFDAGWGVNASNYPALSRAPNAAAPSWPQSANHLSTTHAPAHLNGQADSYARSLSHSPSPYGQNAFSNYGGRQNFQYQQPAYDPSLVPPSTFGHTFNYSTTNYQVPNAGTIAPQVLEHDARSPVYDRNPYDGSSNHDLSGAAQSRFNNSSLQDFVNQQQLLSVIPKGNKAGYFSIINFDDLSKATSSERMGNFLNIAKEACNYESNRAALPAYVPRKSRNELRKTAGSDAKLLAKLDKKSVKYSKAFAAASKPSAPSPARPIIVPERIKREVESSSEEESSSDDDDDDSSYSSDESEPSPLPLKRPDNPKGAVEYDTIKALWRSKRKHVGSDSIRKGLGDFWEIVKTIRDRWKLDAAAVTDAEEKNRANELPLLKSRVKDQRDMIESAVKAALKHGHRSIIEVLAENVPLIFLCYQFLLDRTKAEDYNSTLPRAILELLTMFTTLTEDKLEKTHLAKVLPRYIKRGDAKTQFYAKRIISNAAAAAKERSSAPPANKPVVTETAGASPTTRRAEPEPVAGVKRSASTVGNGGALKKVATGATKPSGTSTATKLNGAVKKPSASADLKAITATTGTTARTKPVVAKPSGFFSSLQSAGKKPGTSIANKSAHLGVSSTASKPAEKKSSISTAASSTAPKPTFSFADTMASLSKPKEERPAPKQEKQEPLETAEQKAKRLRKESRRHLHVSFKAGDELEEVREFQHDPDEELGHDSSQTLDVGDVGGEGRMFKRQHQMMDIDEDEETAEEEQKPIAFTEPSKIDFGDVDPDERQRNYAPYGGGELESESGERTLREHYDTNTLMVIYTDASDIPPNPREPSDPYSGQKSEPIKQFGAPEEMYRVRAKENKMGSTYHNFRAPQDSVLYSNPHQGLDLSKVADFANQSRSQPSTQQSTTMPSSNDALSNILATLKQAAPTQATPPQPQMNGMANPFPSAQPNFAAQPNMQPNGQPDLAAILAQLTQNQPSAGHVPPMGAYGAPSAVPNTTGYLQQQPSMFENQERKQWRDVGIVGGDDSVARHKRQNPAQNPYWRTKVCKYWQEGKCQKGEQCSYKHEGG